jgi:hypothetical protein
MKSLKDLTQVQAALSKIAQRSTIQYDNGSFGMKVKGSIWHVEEQHSRRADELMKIIVAKKFQSLDYTQEKTELDKLPAPKAMIIFKLLEPIWVKGTKIINYSGKNISPEIKMTTEIYIPQDIVDQELVGYEGTEEKTIDIMGMEVPVIELDLKRCMIDVKEGLRDKFNVNRWMRMPRAYVTDIPFRSFQTIGSLMRRDEAKKYQAWNMMSDEDVQLLNESII